jgi:hypothetical protein
LPNIPEPVRLIGNPEENFYILGKKHQAALKTLWQRVMPAESWRSKLDTLTERWRRVDAAVIPDNTWGSWLRAYCEGLEIAPARYLQFLMHMEVGALPNVLVGCTSIFRWDEATQGPQHLRLLDWPLALVDSETSEHILIEAPGKPALLLVCVPGLAFLPMTAMNSHGVTIALHAKYHSLKEADGRPISEAVIEGLLNSKSVLDLRRQLKSFQTQRLWGLNSCDAGGMVLAMDIGGPQVDVLSADLREARLLVFNNAPLVKNKELESAEPPTFTHFCRARREWCLERLEKASADHPLVTLTRAQKLHRVSAPAVTLSTLQSLMLSPALRTFDWMLGTPPLWQQGSMVRWQDLFNTHMRNPQTITVNFPKEERHEWSLRQHYALAQKSLDLQDVTTAFHHLQMGLASAEGEHKALGAWVWAWWQWRHLENKRDRLMLYKETQETLRQTPATYRGHVLLLRLILEVELGLVATVTPLDLPATLRAWSEKYLITPAAERSLLTKELQVRLDIHDLTPLKSWTTGRLLG